ncbi:MAG: cyclic nucleotide-binding domain-containing protein [Caldilineaceae bacterium]|nr:cyclic nucleotide-binding domain-containing protein [Caldilineaceae bacterium]
MSTVSIGLFRNAENPLVLSAGEVVFNQGDPCNDMYVVVEGEVDIVLGEKVLETVSPGGIFGEMALVDDSPRSATARARTACKLAPVNQHRFLYLIQNTPFFALQVMSIMAERIRRKNG